MFSCFLHYILICSTLVCQNGADVNIMNGMGDTPLHRAAFTARTVSQLDTKCDIEL